MDATLPTPPTEMDPDKTMRLAVHIADLISITAPLDIETRQRLIERVRHELRMAWHDGYIAGCRP